MCSIMMISTSCNPQFGERLTVTKEDLTMGSGRVSVSVGIGFSKLISSLNVDLPTLLKGFEIIVGVGVEGQYGMPRSGGRRAG